MVGFITALIVLLFVLYVGALIVVTYVSIHPPRVPLWLSPALLGYPEESVRLESDGLELDGWWSDCGSGELAIICCHGYLMNRCELMPMMIRLADLGASWLFFDFRSHGKSGGRTCTMGKLEAHDVAAAAKWVRERQPHAKIVLFGSSMGGAASAIALGDDPSLADALVLDGAFFSMDEAGRGWWDFIGGKALAVILRPTVFVGRLMLRFDPAKVVIAEYLQRIQHKPALFLAGEDDPIVPIKSMERSAEAAGPDTVIVRFENCGHGEARFKQPGEYTEAIRKFVLESVMGSGDGPRP